MHERLVALGGRGIKVRRLGQNRAGEIRITRFLRNRAVSIEEMVETAVARTGRRVAGLHVLAIQDTTTVRAEEAGRCIALHPVIAVDAIEGALLGLADARFFLRPGGSRAQRKHKGFAEKEGRRWLAGMERAADLASSGAACITVIADREGDIYEDFALKPMGVEVLIRAGQDRLLTEGSRLFERAARLPEAARTGVELPAAPGRPARRATIALRFCEVEIARPVSRKGRTELAALPPSVKLSLVEAREVDPPEGAPIAHWRLLTTHKVADAADARRIVGFYRQRWIIEQLFRTLKTKGFDVEALRLREGGPFEKLVMASLIAAVTVLQLVRERDGAAKRPLEDALDRDQQEALEAVSANLEGKTVRQKNPHPRGSLAFAAWVFARLGGWTGYYGKPGPIVMLHGLVQFHAIKHGWTLRNV
ncbi:MAG: IS4 family transposase [Parvibaculaceae bacterium]